MTGHDDTPRDGRHEERRSLLLLDEFAAQIERLRLLPGGSDVDAERVLAGITVRSRREREATVEMAFPAVLAHPDRFEDAHRLVVKALEVFDRHGWRSPGLPRWLGPLRPLVRYPVELVTKRIVKSYARDVTNQLRRLYERREARCSFELPERRMLARARIAMQRIGPDLAGGAGGLPGFLIGGATLSAIASVARDVHGVSASTAGIVAVAATAFALFAAISWILLQGAAVAHRRVKLILAQPLAALWETVGACGRPPEDDSMTFAAVGIALTAIAWFVTPIVVGVIVYLVR
jgi:hypothetical protein